MTTWSVTDKILAAVAVVVLIAVGVLGFIAIRSDGDDVPDGCEGATLESDLRGDGTPSDVLRVFVNDRAPDFPLGDWVTESVEGGRYTFTSDDGGHFEVEIEDGLVRRYLRCPD